MHHKTRTDQPYLSLLGLVRLLVEHMTYGRCADQVVVHVDGDGLPAETVGHIFDALGPRDFTVTRMFWDSAPHNLITYLHVSPAEVRDDVQTPGGLLGWGSRQILRFCLFLLTAYPHERTWHFAGLHDA